MKKKLLLLLMTASLLSGCGNAANVSVETSNGQTSEETSIVEETAEKIKSTDSTDITKDVDIIRKAFAFDDNGMEAYIEQLKAEDPKGRYSVYNDEYYIQTITEAERQEYLDAMSDKSAIDEAFAMVTTDEQYGGAIVEIKYDDALQNFEIYVDKAKYEENIFACSLGTGLIITAISDSYQAYNLVVPEERIINITIIDKETGTVIE